MEGGCRDMAKRNKLTPKQQKFADYYIEMGNGAQAAIRAGYSEKTARVIAADNLTKPAIKEYIDRIMAQKDAERIASQDEILQFLTSVMRGEVREQIPILNGDGYQRLIDLDETTPKDRIKAAELLGKRHMMWTERQNIDVSHQVQIIDDIGDDEE